jgi:hypothetical protein
MGAIDSKVLEAAGAELAANLGDAMWRVTSGKLYKIIIKGDNDENDLVIPFIPNREQMRFIKRMWNRNLILKARQRGFTTLVAILWLDHALFNANVRCGIISHDRESAEIIFRDKVKFAYENLPPALKAAMPLKKDSATELLFAHNNSSIRVATSMRSGTIHRLHISEFGKICAKYPLKAKEVMTGSIPAVPLNGITIIESTAEGQDGEFHKMTQDAMKLMHQGKLLTKRDYRFHFAPWWTDERYRMSTDGVIITAKDHAYFDSVEAKMKTTLDNQQRAWYVATRDSDFTGYEERMWQEYPSLPEEAFQQSTEGCYLTNQMTDARKQGRICRIPIIPSAYNTFWDVGNGAGTGIWVHYQLGMEHRLIRYHQNSGPDLSYFVKWLQDLNLTWNKHFLPHDAFHERLSNDQNKSIAQQLEDLGLKNIEKVPRISDFGAGINILKKHFPTFCFDEEGCAEGIVHLDSYKRKFNTKFGRYIDEPEKYDGHSECPDALRQLAQALELGMVTISEYTSTMGDRPARDWRAV